MTHVQQLAEINAAITNILTAGQQIGRGGANVRQADLNVLLAERKRLEPLAAAESSGVDTPIVRYGISVRSQ